MRKIFFFALLASVMIIFGATTQASAIWMASGTGSQQTGEGFDEVNGILTDAKCVLTVSAANAAGELPYKLQCFDIVGVVVAHIHAGPADGVGLPVFFLLNPIEGQDFDGLVAEGTISEDLLIDITLEELIDLMNDNGAYLNVHTVDNVPGEVRGQLVAIDDSNIVNEFFLATGSGGQQRAEPIDTDATCIASFRAKGENLKYKLKCFNIEGVTVAHIHLGPAQSEGGVVAFLFAGGPTGPVNGLIRSDDGAKSSGTLKSENLSGELLGAPISDLVERMRTDGAYLNVHTAANPEGEVRGQITVVETLAGGF